MDDRRPKRPDPLACYDCGLLYGGPGWIDTTIPREDWEAISPTGGYGGILCITCMARKLEEVGREKVPLLIGSGPWTHDPTYWWHAGFDAGRALGFQEGTDHE